MGGPGHTPLGAMLTRWQAEQTRSHGPSLAPDRRWTTSVSRPNKRPPSMGMAAWYTEHDDQAAARLGRRTAAAQRQLLADIVAAFGALEAGVYAALELDP